MGLDRFGRALLADSDTSTNREQSWGPSQRACLNAVKRGRRRQAARERASTSSPTESVPARSPRTRQSDAARHHMPTRRALADHRLLVPAAAGSLGDACTQIAPWQLVNEDASTTPMSELLVDADASTPPPFTASTAAASRSPRNLQLAQLRPDQGDEEAPRRAPPQGDEIYGRHFLWAAWRPMHLVTLYTPSFEIDEGMTQIQTNWLGEPEDSGRIDVCQVQRPS